MAQDEQKDSDSALSAEEREAIRNNGTLVLGRHLIQIEGELLRTEFYGDITLAQVLRLLRYYEEMLRLGRRLFVLAVSREDGELMSAEMRRKLADWTRKHPVQCLAVVSDGHWLAVSLISLLLRAINLVKLQPVLLRFFHDEAAARLWIAELQGQDERRV